MGRRSDRWLRSGSRIYIDVGSIRFMDITSRDMITLETDLAISKNKKSVRPITHTKDWTQKKAVLHMNCPRDPIDGDVALMIKVGGKLHKLADIHNLIEFFCDAIQSRQRRAAHPALPGGIEETGKGLYHDDRQVKSLVIFQDEQAEKHVIKARALPYGLDMRYSFAFDNG